MSNEGKLLGLIADKNKLEEEIKNVRKAIEATHPLQPGTPGKRGWQILHAYEPMGTRKRWEDSC